MAKDSKDESCCRNEGPLPTNRSVPLQLFSAAPTVGKTTNFLRGLQEMWVAGSPNTETFKQLPLWSPLYLGYSVGIRNKHSEARIPSLNPSSTIYFCVSLGKLLISLCPNTDNSSTYLIKIKCLKQGLAHGKHLNCSCDHNDFPWAARPQY